MAAIFSLSNFPQRDDEEDENFFIETNDEIIDIMDQIQTMKLQEKNDCYRCEHNSSTYTFGCSLEKKIYFMNSRCRTKMCYWFYDVADSVEISRETVAIAMSYVDQLSCCNTLNKRKVQEIVFASISNFQLASMTCLYIAIKVNESAVFSLKSLVRLSRGKYTEEEIEKMETMILMALEWKLNKPTTMAFVRCYVRSILLLSRMSKNNDAMNNPTIIKEIISEARYQAEIAVSDSSFIKCPPSEIALAALTNSIDQCKAIISSKNGEQKQEKLLFSVEEWCCKGDKILSEKRLRITKLQENLQLLLMGISPSAAGMTSAVLTAVTNKTKNDQFVNNGKKYSSDTATAGTTSVTKKSSPRYSKESPVRVSTSWRLI